MQEKINKNIFLSDGNGSGNRKSKVKNEKSIMKFRFKSEY